MKVAKRKPRWFANVTAYTLAGSLTSGLVGAGIGLLGAVLLPKDVGPIATAIAVTVGLLAIAQVLGWSKIPLPQLARQTRDVWAKTSSGTVAAIRWGLDLGAVFTTWFTFPGVWVLSVVALLVGEPGFGAALFVAHWAGRALAAWLGPLLMRRGADTPQVLAAVREEYPLFRKVHVVGLVAVVALLAAPSGVGVAL